MSKSGYFESKKVRSQVRQILTRTYVMDQHIDEAITIMSPNVAACWVRVTLPRARPGRRARFVNGACACAIVIAPAACEQTMLTDGTIQAMDTAFTTAVANARIELVCETEGVWSVESHVGAWITSTR